MRTICLSLCALALTMAVSGQGLVAPSAPDATILISEMEVGLGPARTIPGGGTEIRGFAVAKNVEIHVGSTVVTADEAEIRYGVAGEPDQVDLRGNVRMKAKIRVDYRQ
jgi:hypothetical protein